MLIALGIVATLVLTVFLRDPVKTIVEDSILMVATLLLAGWIIVGVWHAPSVRLLISAFVGIVLWEIGLRVYHSSRFAQRRSLRRAERLGVVVIPLLKSAKNPQEAEETIRLATRRGFSVGPPRVGGSGRVRMVWFQDRGFGRLLFQTPSDIVIRIEAGVATPATPHAHGSTFVN